MLLTNINDMSLFLPCVAAQVGYGLTFEYYARLDMLFGNKHTSLLQTHTNIKEVIKKELYDTVPGYKITLLILKPFFNDLLKKCRKKNSDIFFQTNEF